MLIRILALAAIASTLACSPSIPDAPPDAGGCGDGGGEPAPPGCPAGVPCLADLAISPPTLVPPFSGGIYDYYVRCEEGTNALTVSMTASSGSTISVLQPTMMAAEPGQSLSLTVSEGEVIVLAASLGSATRDYWIRCLPSDFPQLQWTPHASGCSRTPGYYLFGTMNMPPGVGGYAMVLDTNGVPVWYRSNGGASVYDVETLRTGDISFAIPWQIDKLSPTETGYLRAFGTTPDEHELRALPNGDYLVLSSVTQKGVDLTGLTLPLPDGGVLAYGKNQSIVACDVLEIDSSGAVVWHWMATDHFDPVEVMTYKASNLAVLPVEPFHCNSIDVDPATGNLLVSARHMDSVFYIERSSGKVLWKMGGVDSSKDGATFVPVTDPFFRQHDARLQPGWKETCAGGSGQISVFDDETDVTDGGTDVPGRAAVYDVTIAGEGSGCGDAGGESKATLAWQYENWQTYSSISTGSFRIAADGSRIIGWGQSEPAGSTLAFTEVDERGNDLLDLVCPDGSSSYRAVKVPLSAFDLAALRSNVGLP